MALRPRDRATSIASRYTTQALAEGLRPGFDSSADGTMPSNCVPESVVTSMAGFGSATSAASNVGDCASAESVITFMAGFAPPQGRGSLRWPVLPAHSVPNHQMDADLCLPLVDNQRRFLDGHRWSSESYAATNRAALML